MYTLLLPALGNLLFLALHITGSGSFPRPLSAREEQECLQKIQQGDTAAKNKLIEHNLRLVAHIIKKYYAVSSDQDDLISIGTSDSSRRSPPSTRKRAPGLPPMRPGALRTRS